MDEERREWTFQIEAVAANAIYRYGSEVVGRKEKEDLKEDTFPGPDPKDESEAGARFETKQMNGLEKNRLCPSYRPCFPTCQSPSLRLDPTRTMLCNISVL